MGVRMTLVITQLQQEEPPHFEAGAGLELSLTIRVTSLLQGKPRANTDNSSKFVSTRLSTGCAH